MCEHDTRPKITITSTTTMMYDGRYALEVVTVDHRWGGRGPLKSSYVNLTLPEVLQVLDSTMASEFCDPF